MVSENDFRQTAPVPAASTLFRARAIKGRLCGEVAACELGWRAMIMVADAQCPSPMPNAQCPMPGARPDHNSPAFYKLFCRNREHNFPRWALTSSCLIRGGVDTRSEPHYSLGTRSTRHKPHRRYTGFIRRRPTSWTLGTHNSQTMAHAWVLDLELTNATHLKPDRG
jgi:hypothetical protein